MLNYAYLYVLVYLDSEIIDLFLFPLFKFYTMISITFIIKKFISMSMLNDISDLVSKFYWCN